MIIQEGSRCTTVPLTPSRQLLHASPKAPTFGALPPPSLQSSLRPLFVLFPAVDKNVDGKRFLISHQGASYGSFVVPENLSFSDSYELVETLIKYSTKQNFDGIRLTLPPTIYNRRLSNYIDFALIHHGFRYIKREISSILFLEQTIEENLHKFRSSHRRAVRKAYLRPGLAAF